KSSRRAVIRVTDTGIGMRQKDIPTAMSMFGQIDSTLARKYEGTGLGIPLSNAIVDLHSGKLDIESRLGEGTIVTITLPLARGRRSAEQGDDDTTAGVAAAE
ncbi:MAG: hypothetical protein HKM95_10975, partial [Inquilinus sp.]|nr:hypothetical protein [Inquilinus sp.]